MISYGKIFKIHRMYGERKMQLQYNLQKLQKILRDFHNATGVSISLRNTDFSYVKLEVEAVSSDFCMLLRSTPGTEKYCPDFDRCLFEKCRQSKKMEISICHAGLVDAAVPLFHNDVLLGYISLGQMKRDTAFSSIYDRIRDYPVDMNIMEEYYNKLPLFDNEKIISVANIAEVLAKYILLENMLQPSLDPIIEKAVAYIDAHLAQELTLDQITKSIHTSKSTLYRSFHTHFHCTISEYISRKRIDKSIELLRSSADLSVEEISRQTGFSSATNFIRTFRKLEGVTPLKFRKLQE